MRRLTLVATTAILGLAAACSDSTAPTTTAADAADMAAISAGAATMEDAEITTTELGQTPTGGACPYDAGAGRFVCAPFTLNGLTFNRSYAFYDAGSAPQTAWDATTTASANFQGSVSGILTWSMNMMTGQDTVSRSRNYTVSGLAGAETSRTWNGTGTATHGGFRDDGTRHHTMHVTMDNTSTNVVVNLPRSSNPWPASGTVTRHVVGSGSVTDSGNTRTFTIDRTVTVTFNGTRYVPMTVGSFTYTLDLATGRAVRN